MAKQSNEKVKFENKVINSNKLNPQTARDISKSKLMDKFNISVDEAEVILRKIENKKHDFNDNSEKIQNENKLINNNPNNLSSFQNLNSHKNDTKDTLSLSQGKQLDNQKHFNNKTKPVDDNNVDKLVSSFVSDFSQQVSVELNHVDLTFEVETDKIDTLKETFIRTIKKDKSKKIKINALKDVSLKINKGEKVGIIGYNGAGKSTLLNVITGIYPPDRGDVKTYGKISPLLSLGAGFDSNYSGRKNIYLNGAVLGYEKEFLKEKEQEIIEFSELEDYIDIPIKNYSSGMLAKLGFSIATLVNPDILIIDEILGVGDATFARKSADKIKSLMDGRTTVILVSHAIPQIRNLCDKAIWIDGGCVREIGEVNAVCDNYLKDSEKANKKQLENIRLK